jgi:type 1 glutamine amidotransferase
VESNEDVAMSGPVSAYFVCGGKWHDFDFARVEILKLLGEHDQVRTRVAEDYHDLQALAEADFLVTYTCDLDPVSEEEQAALAEHVLSGKRWLALHGTNSVFEFVEEGVKALHTHPVMMRTLGSHFLAHPPIAPYEVRNAQPDHPLVKGIESFEATDELYLCNYFGEIEPLLETRFTGEAKGFIDRDWPDDEPRLVMYLHPEGRGEVLYLTLGHCRGPYDMRPRVDVYPQVERCSWELPVFYELLRRGLRWAIGGIEAV